jgi:hypothetical protein
MVPLIPSTAGEVSCSCQQDKCQRNISDIYVIKLLTARKKGVDSASQMLHKCGCRGKNE